MNFLAALLIALLLATVATNARVTSGTFHLLVSVTKATAPGCQPCDSPGHIASLTANNTMAVFDALSGTTDVAGNLNLSSTNGGTLCNGARSLPNLSSVCKH